MRFVPLSHKAFQGGQLLVTEWRIRLSPQQKDTARSLQAKFENLRQIGSADTQLTRVAFLNFAIEDGSADSIFAIGQEIEAGYQPLMDVFPRVPEKVLFVLMWKPADLVSPSSCSPLVLGAEMPS